MAETPISSNSRFHYDDSTYSFFKQFKWNAHRLFFLQEDASAFLAWLSDPSSGRFMRPDRLGGCLDGCLKVLDHHEIVARAEWKTRGGLELYSRILLAIAAHVLEDPLPDGALSLQDWILDAEYSGRHYLLHPILASLLPKSRQKPFPVVKWSIFISNTVDSLKSIYSASSVEAAKVHARSLVSTWLAVKENYPLEFSNFIFKTLLFECSVEMIAEMPNLAQIFQLFFLVDCQDCWTDHVSMKYLELIMDSIGAYTPSAFLGYSQSVMSSLLGEDSVLKPTDHVARSWEGMVVRLTFKSPRIIDNADFVFRTAILLLPKLEKKYGNLLLRKILAERYIRQLWKFVRKESLKVVIELFVKTPFFDFFSSIEDKQLFESISWPLLVASVALGMDVLEILPFYQKFHKSLFAKQLFQILEALVGNALYANTLEKGPDISLLLRLSQEHELPNMILKVFKNFFFSEDLYQQYGQSALQLLYKDILKSDIFDIIKLITVIWHIALVRDNVITNVGAILSFMQRKQVLYFPGIQRTYSLKILEKMQFTSQEECDHLLLAIHPFLYEHHVNGVEERRTAVRLLIKHMYDANFRERLVDDIDDVLADEASKATSQHPRQNEALTHNEVDWNKEASVRSLEKILSRQEWDTNGELWKIEIVSKCYTWNPYTIHQYYMTKQRFQYLLMKSVFESKFSFNHMVGLVNWTSILNSPQSFKSFFLLLAFNLHMRSVVSLQRVSVGPFLILAQIAISLNEFWNARYWIDTAACESIDFRTLDAFSEDQMEFLLNSSKKLESKTRSRSLYFLFGKTFLMDAENYKNAPSNVIKVLKVLESSSEIVDTRDMEAVAFCLPVLISRLLSSPSESKLKLESFLEMTEKTYPELVYYELLPWLEEDMSKLNFDVKYISDKLGKMELANPAFAESRKFWELLRGHLALLLDEAWNDTLQGMLKKLGRLSGKSVSLSEVLAPDYSSCQALFKRTFDLTAHDKIRIELVTHFGEGIHRFMDVFGLVMSNSGQKIKELYKLASKLSKDLSIHIASRFDKIQKLSDLAPIILKEMPKSVLLPGKFAINGRSVKYSGSLELVSIEDCLMTIASKTHPKRIRMCASNERSYEYLIKSMDDLRVDARICRLVDCLRQRMPQLGPGYQVIPLSPSFGLIEWIGQPMNVVERSSFSSLFSIFEEWADQQPTGRVPTVNEYQNILQSVDSDASQALSIMTKMTPKDIIWHKILSSDFDTSPFKVCVRRQMFASSLACWSAFGAIIGLGDRHPGNILLDTRTGQVVHVDFSIVFEQGRSLRIPELVPFRLTPNLLHASGGLEAFKEEFIESVSILSSQAELIMAWLQVFVDLPVGDLSKIRRFKDQVEEDMWEPFDALHISDDSAYQRVMDTLNEIMKVCEPRKSQTASPVRILRKGENSNIYSLSSESALAVRKLLDGLKDVWDQLPFPCEYDIGQITGLTSPFDGIRVRCADAIEALEQAYSKPAIAEPANFSNADIMKWLVDRVRARLSMEDQEEFAVKLITEASDHKNKSRIYPGWMPWF